MPVAAVRFATGRAKMGANASEPWGCMISVLPVSARLLPHFVAALVRQANAEVFFSIPNENMVRRERGAIAADQFV